MDKITIERETLERAVDILDRRLNWNPVVDKLCSEINAALAALPAEAQQESVAIVESKFGDPERFGEREIRVLADLSKIPYGTKLYAAQPAPAAVPPGYALVPIEPTHGMLSALTQEWHPSKHGPMKQRYRAMIAAAGDKP